MSLTQKDFDRIDQLIGLRISGLEDKFEEKLEEMNNKLKNLPTKDDFFKAVDQIMKEQETRRDEATIASNQLTDHEDRLTHLEDIHPHGQHVLTP